MMQKMQRLATCLPPTILFEKDEKTKKFVQDNEKDKYKTFEIKLNNKRKTLRNMTMLSKFSKMGPQKTIVSGT